MDREEGTREAVSRRGFLVGVGKLAVGAAVGASALSAVASQSAQAADAKSFTYRLVDPEKVYWNAVEGYYKNACSQGSFDAITKELGEPFSSIPGSIAKWGEGGVVGSGSHCGGLIGTSSAISLAFGHDPATVTKLIKELNQWYMQELGSGSPLCHISVTGWSKENGVTVESQERKDRCARLTGEVAKKGVLLMNAQVEGTFKAAFPGTLSDSDDCISCHGKDGRNDVRNAVAAQDCAPCHDNPHQQ